MLDSELNSESSDERPEGAAKAGLTGAAADAGSPPARKTPARRTRKSPAKSSTPGDAGADGDQPGGGSGRNQPGGGEQASSG
ncbi:MAG: hypothetical protein J2P32_03150, partial [Actinobacteria bacterium]|nr:hypothetical protein [Actinomycetota bacterium]